MRGERVPPQDWLSKAGDVPPDIALAELIETKRELEEGHLAAKQNIGSPIEDERYEFIEVIARGGSAVVWRVRDRHLGRETAVKYLLDSQDNVEMRARLEREARLCARLVHPGIVPIHELSSFADQRPFVSMKLVEGKTLLQLLESDPPLSISSIIEIFTKACQAVAFAHDKGIIHRDLKPSNIMVGSFGEVQVMDWGLAKDLRERQDDIPTSPAVDKNADTLADAKLNEATIVGSVFGTIAYMSPEQARGQTVLIDKWSDVFSLGAVLCRVLTGVPPYQEIDKSLDQDAMLVKAKRGDLELAFERLSKAKPRKLAELATRCLSVMPTTRPADAGELVKELAKISKAAQRTAKTRQFLGVAAGILVMVSGALFWANRNAQNTKGATIVVNDPAPALNTFTFRELVTEKVTLDGESAKVLLKSDKKDVVLDNYRSILDKSPMDEELYFSIELAFMNSGKWTEGEEVARDLIKMNPGNADYHFMLSESLSWRGKYDEAKTIMLHSKALRDDGFVAQYPIDNRLSKLEKYTEIIKQVSTEPPPTFESHTSEGLLEVGNVCGQADKFELANRYYKLALSKEADTYRQTFSRNGLLLEYVQRILKRTDLRDDTRRSMSVLCLEWIQEQVDSKTRLEATQATHLIRMLKSPAFDFARKLVEDDRLDPEIRDELKKLWTSIEEM